MAIFCFLVWYYPVGFYRNAELTDTVNIRAFQTLMTIVAAFLFSSSLAHMIIAGLPNEEIAGGVATLASIMLYAFCGILVGPTALPRFWIFMYRVSYYMYILTKRPLTWYKVNPFTYLVSTFMSSTLGQATASCDDTEFQTFFPPANQTCGEYMRDYISTAGGFLRDSGATDQCSYCQIDNTNQFLERINVNWDTRWRDFGILWVYIVFNVAAAVSLYWLCRVPKGKKKT